MTHALTTTVIVLTWNGLEETQRCLDALARVRDDVRVIVVDNGSRIDEASVLRARCDAFPHPLRVLRSDTNRGFAGGVNLALRAMQADAPTRYALLLNNDALLPDGLVTRFVAELAQRPRLGIIGATLAEDRGLVGPGRIDWWSGATPFYARPIDGDAAVLVETVHGACFCFRAELLARIGFFDERYHAYYEETDFCVRARRAGFELACLAGARVPHVGGAGVGAVPGLREYLIFRSRLLFLSKLAPWPQRWVAAARTIAVDAPRHAARAILNRDWRLVKAHVRGLIDGARAAPPRWP